MAEQLCSLKTKGGSSGGTTNIKAILPASVSGKVVSGNYSDIDVVGKHLIACIQVGSATYTGVTNFAGCELSGDIFLGANSSGYRFIYFIVIPTSSSFSFKVNTDILTAARQCFILTD